MNYQLYFDGMHGYIRVKPIRKAVELDGTDLFIVEAREQAYGYHHGDIIESPARYLVNKIYDSEHRLMHKEADTSKYF